MPAATCRCSPTARSIAARHDRRRRRARCRARRERQAEDVVDARALRTQVGGDRSRRLVSRASRRASWSATSTPTSRSTGPATPCTSRRAALARARRAAAVRSAERSSCTVSDTERQGDLPPVADGRRVRRRRTARCSRAADGGARLLHRPRHQRRSAGAGSSRCRNTASPSSRSSSPRPRASSCRASEAVATVQARYYFGQPVANARVRYVVTNRRYYSPLRWDDGDRRRARARTLFYGDERADARARCGSTPGRGEIRLPPPSRRERRATTARASRRRSPTRAAARSAASTTVHATYGRSCSPRR